MQGNLAESAVGRQAGDGATAPRIYIDFNLELRDFDNAADTFVVTTVSSVGESQPSLVPLRIDQLRSDLSRLERKQLSYSKLADLGRALGDRLLPEGEIRELFRAAERAAGREGGVRLRLLIRDEQLAQLPWEYSCLPDRTGELHRSNFLALNPQLSLVRHEVMAAAHPSLSAPGPKQLRLVIALADVTTANVPGYGPVELAELDLDEERAAIERAVRDLEELGIALEAETLTRTTPEALRRRLLEGADLFHFAGHGVFTEASGFILLRKAADDAAGTLLHADDLAAMLQGAGVRLAVLGACESARRDGRSVWSGVAPTLVRQGLAAVVAMQYEILDEQAAAFSRMLYTALCAGLTLDEAVATGRQVMARGRTGVGTEWGVPVLYMRSPDGVLFPQSARHVSEARDGLRVVVEQFADEIAAGAEMTGIRAAEPLKSGDYKVLQEGGTVQGRMTGYEVKPE